MIGIVFSVIKIVTIIVLALIALLLVIGLLILFSPFIYRGRISYKKEADVDISLSWFFKFINISVRYKEDLRIIAKLAWFFKVYSNESREEDLQEDIKEEVTSESESLKFKISPDKKSQSGNASFEEMPKKVSTKEEKKDSNIQMISDLNKSERKRSRKVLNRAEDIKNGIGDRIKNITNNIKSFTDIINDERNKKLFFFLGDKAKKLLKYSLPKKIKGYIKFGFDDPSTTGQLLSGLAIFYPLYKDDFKIIPMFYDEIFEIDISFKRGIRLVYILYVLAVIWFNKNFKRAYRIYKNRKVHNGKE